MLDVSPEAEVEVEVKSIEVEEQNQASLGKINLNWLVLIVQEHVHWNGRKQKHCQFKLRRRFSLNQLDSEPAPQPHLVGTHSLGVLHVGGGLNTETWGWLPGVNNTARKVSLLKRCVIQKNKRNVFFFFSFVFVFRKKSRPPKFGSLSPVSFCSHL